MSNLKINQAILNAKAIALLDFYYLTACKIKQGNNNYQLLNFFSKSVFSKDIIIDLNLITFEIHINIIYCPDS